MTNLEKKLVAYANAIIDNRCEWEGPNSVILDLVEFGFTGDELVEMGFDTNAELYRLKQVIDTAIENNKEVK